MSAYKKLALKFMIVTTIVSATQQVFAAISLANTVSHKIDCAPKEGGSGI